MPERDYSNASQQLLLDIIVYMAEHSLDAMTIKDIHDHLGGGRDRIFRAVWNLEKAGLVFKNRDKHYQLTTRWTALFWPLCSRTARLTADLHKEDFHA